MWSALIVPSRQLTDQLAQLSQALADTGHREARSRRRPVPGSVRPRNAAPPSCGSTPDAVANSQSSSRRASLSPPGSSARAIVMQRFLVRRLPRRRAAVADAVQAHIGRHAIQQAGRIPRVEPAAPLDQPHEHVLTRIERLVLVAQELAAPSQHHRSVAAAEGADVQLVHHAGDLTPQGGRSVTGYGFV